MSRKAVLFIAMSLDGYIADKEGSVDWLNELAPEGGETDSYGEFIREVDTVLMGWKTYHQVATELSPDQWVYEGLQSYVFTHRELPDKEDICFTSEDPCQLLRRLKEEPGRTIWICGGASLVGQLAAADLIDEYQITVMPILLGGGILFSTLPEARKLALLSGKVSQGMAELRYGKQCDCEESF